MRLIWIFAIAILSGCGTAEQKTAKSLNDGATKTITPPTFDEPSEALRSIYLVECPKCKAKQFLVPLRILSTGGTSVTNGNLTDRALYFVCSKRTCKNIITTYDQVLVEPVKAVRVR